MKFQILSHAGMSLEGAGVNLVFDPWLVGSTYWRSWWNYPPVPRELIEGLRPDFIYLTHIHWDHFQGPSLRKFNRSTPIIVPKGNYSRMKQDLHSMDFENVIELKHRESMELSPGLRITSYQCGVFLDSAVMVECEGYTLFNANDAKFMGLPLREILRRHPKIDFVFRSHSSANSFLCYEIIDKPSEPVDDTARYIRNFANFARTCGARYAIPFASNHCHLHKDVFHFNRLVQTPHMVKEHFEKHHIESPIVKIMVSGDSWSSEKGFVIRQNEILENRDQFLKRYRKSKQEILERYYRQEERVVVKLGQLEKYFHKFFQTIPFLVRFFFKDQRIAYVLHAGEQKYFFEVDVFAGKVRQLDTVDDSTHSMQIHTSTMIMRDCMAKDLFGHLGISKRVRFRTTFGKKKYLHILDFLFNMYEYDMLPVRRNFQRRSVETWLLRWREVIFYFQALTDYAFGGKLDLDRYLLPETVTPKSTGS